MRPSPYNIRTLKLLLSRIPLPRVLVFLTCSCFCVLVYSFSVATRVSQLRSNVLHAAYRSSTGKLVTPPLTPLVTVISNVELFFMLPPRTAAVRGVLIFFHGCNHSGQDMFELPEDRIVALAALNRGLAVLSPTSQDRDSGCWGHDDVEILGDGNVVGSNNVVGKWMASVGLPGTLPRMGMGASSGGSILFSVYQRLGLKSIASYVSGKSFTKSELIAGNLPATVYVHMPKDARTAGKIEESYKALVSYGIPVLKIEIDSHPFTTQLCARRLPEFGDRRCQAFIDDVLESKKNLLNKDDMSVLVPVEDWQEVMKKAKLDNGLKASSKKEKGTLYDKNSGGHSWLWASMGEEIAASLAVHEMTAERREDVLDFLMKHAGISIE